MEALPTVSLGRWFRNTGWEYVQRSHSKKDTRIMSFKKNKVFKFLSIFHHNLRYTTSPISSSIIIQHHSSYHKCKNPNKTFFLFLSSFLGLQPCSCSLFWQHVYQPPSLRQWTIGNTFVHLMWIMDLMGLQLGFGLICGVLFLSLGSVKTSRASCKMKCMKDRALVADSARLRCQYLSFIGSVLKLPV